MTDEVDFFAAWRLVLGPLVDRQHVLGLVEGLDGSGALARLTDPVRRDDLGEALGTTKGTAAAVAHALLLHEVLEESDGRLRLTAPWRALVADTAVVRLADCLASARLEARLLRSVGAGDYWTMETADRILLARSVSPDPFADGVVADLRRAIETDPLRRDLLEPGCRLLELGCGVAGRILTMLRAVPTLTAVGVELSPDLAAEAVRRAAALGLDQRFSVVCADAAAYRTDERFDRAFWSQFFFPDDSRAGALAAMHAAVRPGGVVGSPVAGDDPSDAVFRVLVSSWGVPLRTTEELAAEYRDAGFVDVQVLGADSPGPTSLRAVRP